MNNITIVANLCSSTDNSNCSKVDLIISQDELKKFQLVEYSNGNNLNVDSDYAEIWGIAFSSVLFLYFFSLGIGHVLSFLKKV